MSEVAKDEVAKMHTPSKEDEVINEKRTSLEIEGNTKSMKLETASAVSQIDNNEQETSPSAVLECTAVGEDISPKVVVAVQAITPQNVESDEVKSNEAEDQLPKDSSLEFNTPLNISPALENTFEHTSNDAENVTCTADVGRSPEVVTIAAVTPTEDTSAESISSKTEEKLSKDMAVAKNIPLAPNTSKDATNDGRDVAEEDSRSKVVTAIATSPVGDVTGEPISIEFGDTLPKEHTTNDGRDVAEEDSRSKVVTAIATSPVGDVSGAPISIDFGDTLPKEHTTNDGRDLTEEDSRSKVVTTIATATEDVKSETDKKPAMDSVLEGSTAMTSTALENTSKKVGDEYAAHVTYTDDGSAIYTDPETNYKYKWSEKENNWVSCNSNVNASSTVASSTSADNPYENEHYMWCATTQKWIPKEQVTETEHYKWDAEKHEWIAKTPAVAEPTATTQTGKSDLTNDIAEHGADKDGADYFWDVEKNAWFPKIDDDFMARYQMNYGFIDNTSASEEEKRQRDAKEAKRKVEELKCMAEEAKAAAAAADASTGAAGGAIKRKATQEPPKWFDLDPEHNTKVYVSNLPLDITIDEFAELMSKCGMIMRDPQTQKYKLKLYTEADGQIKGDGLCDYIKVESVGLAMNILDEYNLRGHKIRVQPAKFQMRGEYNPALKPKRKKKDKEKLQKMKEKLFDWRPEKMRGERTKNEKVVIIKNLFEPEMFEKEVQLILEYQNDLREECGKCGTVRKVVIYDRHVEGVAQVNMSSPEEADLVIQMMQGRYFGKRQLSADHWDGKTKYKITESEKEVQERLSNWDKFLETGDEKMKQPAQVQVQEQYQSQEQDTTQSVKTKVTS